MSPNLNSRRLLDRVRKTASNLRYQTRDISALISILIYNPLKKVEYKRQPIGVALAYSMNKERERGEIKEKRREEKREK